MTIITVQSLVRCGIGPTQARQFADPIAHYAALFKVETPADCAAFVAQSMHESTNFTHLEECLFYRDAARAVRLFRTAFDKDRDGVADPQEIAEAMQYMQNPQKLANRAYANRNGNGPEESGDGWRYRGRGLFQLTGLNNYRIATHLPGAADYVAYPDLVAQPDAAVLTAFGYWQKNNCAAAFKTGGIDAVTRVVNPAMAGKMERREAFAACLSAFGG